ncbi:Sulfite reductase [NADPH] flavoprotein alpha-component [Buchnera aphidicola (Thelaxes suberi)]|uniref:assimilatory sulfite reductase (NADPH) flavoprotein subunit n=1 Tax=Buchnera aphidicola TaxID=9 RepID=UPI0034643759
MKKKDETQLIHPFSEKQMNILNSFAENLTINQCIWTSGFFWGLTQKNSISEKLLTSSEINTPVKENINQLNVTIISASQTGNARLVSEYVQKHLLKFNIPNQLFDANEYKFKKIHLEKILILVISTQGEGEPPEIALPMYNFLKSKQAPNLNNLTYSIFSLGDSSYEYFCQAGKDFDNILSSLGAKKLINRIDADVDYNGLSIKWCDDIINVIKKKNTVSLISNNNFNKKTGDNKFVQNTYNKMRPFTSTLIVNQKITGRYSKKDVRHIELNIMNSGIKYYPGDSIGIWYKNDAELILEILEILNINQNEKILFNKKYESIFNVLENNFELTTNNINVLKKYALINNHVDLLKIASDLKKRLIYVKKNSLVCMLKQFPSIISAQDFVSILVPLKPRFYSISSSQLENDEEIHITVNIVQNYFYNKVYLGGASGYLSKLVNYGDKVKIFIEKNNNFKLPINDNSPIIMIASGTGIAPFRSFLQERENKKAHGKNWLFFGNQSSSEDFLYQQEWQIFFKKGLLNRINLAWSQDQDKKIYVQDELLKNGKKIWKWINTDKAYIYVCGNASKMAKDVENTLIQIICEYNHVNTEEANNLLNTLRLEKRYQRDVY